MCEMGGLHLRALRSQHALEVRRRLDAKEQVKRLKRRSVGQLVRLTEAVDATRAPTNAPMAGGGSGGGQTATPTAAARK